MAIIVEHDKRKQKILQNSLDVFVEEGYEDATFQKIADRCGITRTTLYIYFKNKHEIFLESIKELLEVLEKELRATMANPQMNNEAALRAVMNIIIDKCEENPKLFNVLLNYLMQLRKAGVDTNDRVKRRIIRIRHLLTTIVINGINKGEFKKLNIKAMDDLLYSQFEAAIFRIAVLNLTDMAPLRASINLAIDSFLN